MEIEIHLVGKRAGCRGFLRPSLLRAPPADTDSQKHKNRQKSLLVTALLFQKSGHFCVLAPASQFDRIQGLVLQVLSGAGVTIDRRTSLSTVKMGVGNSFGPPALNAKARDEPLNSEINADGENGFNLV
jgi:hypothetical protein